MTKAASRRPPAYRTRKGYSQAIVTLTDSVTGKRRDYWLGEHGTPESREAYYRLLAEYEALGRRLPERSAAAPAPAAEPGGVVVAEVALEYWRRVAREFLPKPSNAIRAPGGLELRNRVAREIFLRGRPALAGRKPPSRTTQRALGAQSELPRSGGP